MKRVHVNGRNKNKTCSRCHRIIWTVGKWAYAVYGVNGSTHTKYCEECGPKTEI